MQEAIGGGSMPSEGGFSVGEAASYAQLASMAQGLFSKKKPSAMERRMNQVKSPQEAVAEAKQYGG